MILDHHPEIGERILVRGVEFAAHGWSNSERQGMSKRSPVRAEVERLMLARRVETELAAPADTSLDDD